MSPECEMTVQPEAADDAIQQEPGSPNLPECPEVPGHHHKHDDDHDHDHHGRSHSWFFRKFIEPVLHINDEPKAVAGGVTLGIIVAMTPTVGIQMILVTIVNTIFRVNRLAGILMVWISNPLTLIPIYWLDYWVGSILMQRDLMTYEAFSKHMSVILDKLKDMDMWSGFIEFMGFLGELAAPLFLGGFIVGIVCGIPMYPITLKAVKRHRARKEARRLRKLARRHSLPQDPPESPPQP